MTQINSGTLKTNKPMSTKSLLKAMEILKGYNAEFEENEISFEDAYGYLEESLDKLVDVFLVDGLTLEGEIQYHGDYEGRYVYRPGCHGENDEVMLLCDQPDEKLIAELERRGYHVMKK